MRFALPTAEFAGTVENLGLELKLFLADAAVGADPILGDIFPLGAGGDAVIGISDCLIIDIAANDTDILFHVNFLPFSFNAECFL
jgi:hypothetical protein